MRRFVSICILLLFLAPVSGQQAQTFSHPGIYAFPAGYGIQVTADRPALQPHRPKTLLVFYALPNGNSTAQTMGKKMEPGDDWHYDIQHIAAQTGFLRQQLKKFNIVVIYLENRLKSWPAWKQQHPGYREILPRLIDSLVQIYGGKSPAVYLNGHSGGGSLIFGYLAGVGAIPSYIRRISFLDSNYGYDSSYFPVLQQWLRRHKKAVLNVFAYNDSVALYNGKPVVSATGGTWYRAHRMLDDFGNERVFRAIKGDSIHSVFSRDKKVQFFFKSNLNRGIYHTQQVELNGFIHSILSGTKWDEKGYRYYGQRAYGEWIR